MAEVAMKRRSRITPEREAALYQAVLSLLREVGYDALTVEAVAARTRFSKATLYRQWGGKAELVVKALQHGRPIRIDDCDTGTLRGDLHALVAAQGGHAQQQNSALMRGLATAIPRNSNLRDVFREQRVATEAATFHRLLERAAERGEIRLDVAALPYAVHMTLGALIAHAMLSEQSSTQAVLTSYIDAVVLPALGVPSTDSPASRDVTTQAAGPTTPDCRET